MSDCDRNVGTSAQVPTLTELHEAATPAPWEFLGEYHYSFGGEELSGYIIRYADGTLGILACGLDKADAALIVALRNAYASGELVERAHEEWLCVKCNTVYPYSSLVGDGLKIRCPECGEYAVVKAQHDLEAQRTKYAALEAERDALVAEHEAVGMHADSLREFDFHDILVAHDNAEEVLKG